MSLAAGKVNPSPMVKGFLALAMKLASKNGALSADAFSEMVAFNNSFNSLCSHFFSFGKLRRLVRLMQGA